VFPEAMTRSSSVFRYVNKLGEKSIYVVREDDTLAISEDDTFIVLYLEGNKVNVVIGKSKLLGECVNFYVEEENGWMQVSNYTKVNLSVGMMIEMVNRYLEGVSGFTCVSSKAWA
jgi:hypothetical protein